MPIAVADVAWNIFSFVVSVKGIICPFSTTGSDWPGVEHGAQLKHQNGLTYEVRVVSVESDEEAEEVTDRHDQLKELVEGQNLKKVRENEHCFNLTIAVFKGLRHTFLQNHWSLLAKYQLWTLWILLWLPYIYMATAITCKAISNYCLFTISSSPASSNSPSFFFL